MGKGKERKGSIVNNLDCLVKVRLFLTVAVHLAVKMADTLSFTAKVDTVDF